MTSKTQLDFGSDQDYDVDPEIITRVFIAVETVVVRILLMHKNNCYFIVEGWDVSLATNHSILVLLLTTIYGSTNFLTEFLSLRDRGQL